MISALKRPELTPEQEAAIEAARVARAEKDKRDTEARRQRAADFQRRKDAIGIGNWLHIDTIPKLEAEEKRRAEAAAWRESAEGKAHRAKLERESAEIAARETAHRERRAAYLRQENARREKEAAEAGLSTYTWLDDGYTENRVVSGEARRAALLTRAREEADAKERVAKERAAAAKPPGQLSFEMFADVKPDLDRRALVDGLLDHGAMSVLYGDSNTGKTFVALSLGFAIATGREWHGRKVEQGGVVYVAAEAGGNVKKRVAALRKLYGVEAAAFALVPCPIDLGGAGADVEPLLKLIAEAQKAMGCSVVLIVIDTLSRAMGGGEENASKDMTAFVRNIDRLREKTKAHLLVVHHSGKDQARGARGHSSLRAATDTEIEVANMTIAATKQRDMDAGAPIGFKLEPVVIGTDADGRVVTSCVAIPAAVPPKPVELCPSAVKARTVLENACLGGGKMAVDEWRQEFDDEYYPKPEQKEAAKKAFQRGTAQLVRAGLVRIENNMAWPTSGQAGDSNKS